MTKSGADISRRTSTTDCYSTPAWAIRALLDVERFPGVTLEPAAGEGAIVDELADINMDIDGSDIHPLHMFSARIDFLSDKSGYRRNEYDNVITNPPFSLAQEFAERALIVASNKVALFLRLQFLESAKRYKWLKASPLKAVYVFSSRVSLVPFGQEKRTGSNGTACHAWFVWNHIWKGEPVIRWIPPHKGS